MKSEDAHYRTQIVDSLTEIDEQEWQALLALQKHRTPFLSYAFCQRLRSMAVLVSILVGIAASCVCALILHWSVSYHSTKNTIPMANTSSIGHGRMPITSTA